MSKELAGVNELLKQLDTLDAKLQAKAIRSAAMQATTSTLREMKAKAPVGNESHRTYKGRLVAPGFLRRNIKRASRVRDGKVAVSIGVAKEAWYGLLIDTGPHKISMRDKKSIKPYTLRRKNWLTKTFIDKENKMLSELKAKLKKQVLKATR
jgi:HK97 gp10 family phage protein